MIVVLISGRGSNMQALLDAGPAGERGDQQPRRCRRAWRLPPGAALPRAWSSIGATPTREAFDAALGAEIDRFAPRLVALAGFMRVLTPAIRRALRERLLNIHPSLLPAFPGLHTHERALAAGVKVHGCTVHFVTAELDHGPIVVQAAVPVRAGDDAGDARRPRAAAGARDLSARGALVPRGQARPRQRRGPRQRQRCATGSGC